MALLDRRTRYVPWSAVETVEGRTVTINCAIAELAVPEPVHDPGSGS